MQLPIMQDLLSTNWIRELTLFLSKFETNEQRKMNKDDFSSVL